MEKKKRRKRGHYLEDVLGETKNEAQLMYLKKTEEHSDGLKRNPIKEESLADALKNHFALPSYENTSTTPWITQKQPAKNKNRRYARRNWRYFFNKTLA